MDQKISVTVRIDLDGSTVRILVSGFLTSLSQRALHPLIRRAHTLSPGVRVIVDLSPARAMERDGLRLLREEIAHYGSGVEFIIPDPLPTRSTGIRDTLPDALSLGLVGPTPGD